MLCGLSWIVAWLGSESAHLPTLSRARRTHRRTSKMSTMIRRAPAKALSIITIIILYSPGGLGASSPGAAGEGGIGGSCIQQPSHELPSSQNVPSSEQVTAPNSSHALQVCLRHLCPQATGHASGIGGGPGGGGGGGADGGCTGGGGGGAGGSSVQQPWHEQSRAWKSWQCIPPNPNHSPQGFPRHSFPQGPLAFQ